MREGSVGQHYLIVYAGPHRWFVPGEYLFLNEYT
jgi:hypothetical protein